MKGVSPSAHGVDAQWFGFVVRHRTHQRAPHEIGAKVDRGEMEACVFDTSDPAITVELALKPDRDAVVAPARLQLR